MKSKHFLLIFLISSSLSFLSFTPKQNEVKYYVAYGWENANYCNSGLSTAWVYSNVVRVSCDYISDRGVFNQFSDHYASKYGSSRCKLLSGSYATGFDTYDEAAAFRREKLAERQRADNVAPILINDFSYYCK